VSQLKQQALQSKLTGIMKDGSNNDTRFSSNFNPSTQSESLTLTDQINSSSSSNNNNNNNIINSSISNITTSENFQINSHHIDPSLCIEWDEDESKIKPKNIDSDVSLL
jgi:hypothetical protein